MRLKKKLGSQLSLLHTASIWHVSLFINLDEKKAMNILMLLKHDSFELKSKSSDT